MDRYAGKNKRTVNYLKTIYFDYPEWTIAGLSLMPATWLKYREELEDVVLRHPRLFPGYRKGQTSFDGPWSPMYTPGFKTDAWGCGWNSVTPGLDSYIEVHPLEDWAAFDTWQPPDPLRDSSWGPRDWEGVAKSLERARANGDLAVGGGLQHGHFYMLLYYLRGFENLMMDMATDDPRLHRLIDIVTGYNVAVVRKYLELGVEMMSFGEDLGNQKALPISPQMWRTFIKPGYEATMGPCRDAGIPVYLHSDGHILEIIPDLIEVGVRVLNPQIRANGLAGLQQVARGRVCLNQDLDRQLFPFASPAEIEDHIAAVHAGLNLPEGGLMLSAEAEPDVPLEIIDVIAGTLERVCNLPDPDSL